MENKWWEYISTDKNGNIVHLFKSNREILTEYFNDYSDLLNVHKRTDIVSPENCIKAWVRNYCAWESHKPI